MSSSSSPIPPPYSTADTTTTTTTTSRPSCCSVGSACCSDTPINVLSAVVNTAAMLVACVALGHPRWLWVEGRRCYTHSLGLHHFLTPGHFSQVTDSHFPPTTLWLYYTGNNEAVWCVTRDVVVLLQVVIGLIILLVISALCQVVLDLIAPTQCFLAFLRKNSIPSIMAVWMCAMGVGIVSSTAIMIEAFPTNADVPPQDKETHTQVKFEIGFYLLVTAGWLSVVGVACNWLRPSFILQELDEEPLIDGVEIPSISVTSESSSNPPPNSSDPSTPDPSTLTPTLPLLPPPPTLPYFDQLVPPPPIEGYPPPPYTP